MLTDKQICSFQDMYKNRFGRDISREEATEKGLGLINILKSININNKINEKFQ